MIKMGKYTAKDAVVDVLHYDGSPGHKNWIRDRVEAGAVSFEADNSCIVNYDRGLTVNIFTDDVVVLDPLKEFECWGSREFSKEYEKV